MFETRERNRANDLTRQLKLLGLDPSSGGGKGKQVLDALADIIGKDRVFDLGANPHPEQILAQPHIVEEARTGLRVIVCGGDGTMTWLMAEDFHPCARFGDRTLSRYRSMARKALGDAAPVIADAPDDPVRTVLAEVLDEVERVQLLLRLSPRLREVHGD